MAQLDVAIATLAFAGGLVAALIGAGVGHRLASEREDQQLRREAAEGIIATAMESLAQLAAIDTAITGGPSAPDVRPDFGRDALLSMARIRLMGTPEARQSAKAIYDALLAAVAVHFDRASTGADRESSRDAVMAAIDTFGDQAARDFRR